MHQEQWKCKQSQHKPDVEVECQVLKIECPRLSAVEIWSPSRREDVVLDNVPANDGNLFVEEEVDEKVGKLETLASAGKIFILSCSQEQASRQ